MIRPRPVIARRRLLHAVATAPWIVLLASCGDSNPPDTHTVLTATPTPATVTTLYSFTGNASGGSGAAPHGSLVMGQDGNLCGTTPETVFRITTAGEATTLYSFPAPTDANYAGGTGAGLILASDGNFYGTTQGNGIGNNISGTVYRMSPTGAVSTINTFSGADLGDLPMSSGVIQGHDGRLYGIAFTSMIFSMTTTGTVETETPIAGYPPQVSLVQARDGTLYGATSGGGLYGTTAYGGTPSVTCPQGCGTVFRITPSGVETVLYSFGADPTDGQSPSGALVLANDGNFYGTTLAGGSPNANCTAAARSTGSLRSGPQQFCIRSAQTPAMA